MSPITRINLDASTASEIASLSSLSKYNLRPREVPARPKVAYPTAPEVRTRRRPRNTPAFPETMEGAPPTKKVRLNTSAEGPVFRTRTDPAKRQQSTPVLEEISPMQLIRAGQLLPLQNYLKRNPLQADVKAILLQATAQAGWLKAFDLLLASGALADYRQQDQIVGDEKNSALLHAAIYGGNVALLKRLVELECPLHERSRDELKTAVISSVLSGRVNMIAIFCNAADEAGIHWAPCEMAAFFTAAIHGAQCEMTNYVWDIPAISCLTKRYPGSCEASVFAKAAFAAVNLNHWEAVSVLISVYGASPDSVNDRGASLLMAAAKEGRLDIYELLRFHNASPDAIDDEGNSVLHHAIQGGNDAIAYDLVANCGVAPDVRNNDGVDALSLAASLDRDYAYSMIMTAAQLGSAEV